MASAAKRFPRCPSDSIVTPSNLPDAVCSAPPSGIGMLRQAVAGTRRARRDGRSADPSGVSTMSGVPLPLLVLIFIGAAGAIWVAGVFLSNTVDVLDTRLHLGAALGGTIVLAIATNLPEIAITASAALQHSVDVAVG